MQKTITKREYLLDAYGRTFSVTAYWGTSLRANVGVGAELVERPEWEAPEAEWKAWREAQKDLTVRWYVDTSALLCVPCHLDGAKPAKPVRPASHDEHPEGLVRLSPAALRAMA